MDNSRHRRYEVVGAAVAYFGDANQLGRYSAWLNVFRHIATSRREAAGFGAERACVSEFRSFPLSVAQKSQTIPESEV
jgi:hypothetical protein